MADNRTMAQLLQAPTKGYEDAIVILEINANFELKHGLINLVQNKQFFGHDKEDPHAHIRYFNKITSTMRFPDVPRTSIKLMLFPFSLEVSALICYEKRILLDRLTWMTFSKFIINSFLLQKLQIFVTKSRDFNKDLTNRFNEAWDRFKNDLLRHPTSHFPEITSSGYVFTMLLNANDSRLIEFCLLVENFLDKIAV
ncbi:hypothetical protein Tco_0762038 [Tanacetum coccineum]